eukprot:TRINITY_DN12342_c0_g1_i2.p1 TRINITY_DN12342_c0_g1~~TRINITY_DN12342_c0_g1_i2.p1  ORF type:complete len:601 (-),score=144.37 TRINITY_DN12342_c0_g1_i2:513-2315(-)
MEVADELVAVVGSETAQEDIPFMDDKMADDLKEKTSADTSKISKETKVVKKVTAAQNKTTNVLKSNPRTTLQASPKSSQPKFSATPTKSKFTTSRASSATEGRKETTVRRPLSGVNTTRKTKESPNQPKSNEIKKTAQTERKPISGISKPLAKSSTLQNKDPSKDLKKTPIRKPVSHLNPTKAPTSGTRNKPEAANQIRSKAGAKSVSALKPVAKSVQNSEAHAAAKPKPNGVQKSMTNNSIANVKPGTKSPDAQLSKMSLSISNPTGISLPPFNRQISTGDQLITFKDTLNPKTDFDQLSRLLDGSLDDKEKQCLTDLKEYLVKKEDAWILDPKLLNFIGGLLEHRSLNSEIRVKLLRLMAAGALRVDFWSFLQMDRKDRHLMKYPNDFEDLTVEEQKAVALFLCNNFSSGKGADWLMYGSPWKVDEKEETSNVRITSKVAAYSLVSYTPSLQDYGSAMIYNIALKEAKALSVPVAKYTEEGLPTVELDYGSVSDKDIMTNSSNGLSDTKFVTLKVYNDVAVELCMAILKFIKKTKDPNEEILYRCVKSLLKFSLILKADLLSCIAMVQTDLDEQVPGKSARIDTLWSQLRQQLLNNSE